MLDLPKLLSPELIASGLIGLAMLGVVARNAIVGWAEARAKMKELERDPMVTAMGMAWDRDQMERIIVALETIAESQAIMSDNFQNTLQGKLADILERMDIAQSAMPKPRPRRKPRPKAKVL